ncbi:AraC family transcriptional regulator [Luteimonas saliphila]|uniref:AraC family transcriptional regulator n=1 Tax=Luteimonas saliphila TaxID=2804919 RepID=UPI00192DED55|nr:AraC family transcriptional regulator [Luteimonas saliphila]
MNPRRIVHTPLTSSSARIAQRDGWSTLVVGLESGFGSLGAFHRTFKAAEGCTPGEYRSARPAPEGVAGRQPA